jgi:hypothetical protein
VRGIGLLQTLATASLGIEDWAAFNMDKLAGPVPELERALVLLSRSAAATFLVAVCLSGHCLIQHRGLGSCCT